MDNDGIGRVFIYANVADNDGGAGICGRVDGWFRAMVPRVAM